MRVLKRQPRPASWLNHAGLMILLAVFFLIGLKLSDLAFASPSRANPPAEAADKPAGGALVKPPLQVHNFALTNQGSASMSLKDLRGRAIVLFFGYTHCPDVCPNTLANFTLVKKLLGAEANSTAFVLVTVDSQRDTPAIMKEYLSRFDSGFIGLTGDAVTLRSMAAEYGAYFSVPADQPAGDAHSDHHEDGIDSANYFVQHTSPAYLIDPKGFLRVVYFNGTSPAVIADGVRQILQEAN